MTMRMGSFGLSVDDMSGYGERYFEPGPTAWIRFHGQLAAEQADALFDDRRPMAGVLLVGRRQAARERKPAPVVVDCEPAGAVGDGQPDEHVARAAVLPHVDERLLNDARHFPAG